MTWKFSASISRIRRKYNIYAVFLEWYKRIYDSICQGCGVSEIYIEAWKLLVVVEHLF